MKAESSRLREELNGIIEQQKEKLEKIANQSCDKISLHMSAIEMYVDTCIFYVEIRTSIKQSYISRCHEVPKEVLEKNDVNLQRFVSFFLFL